MTTEDENTNDMVGSLFREVDDHFADLEQQYNDARRQLASADDDRREREVDYVQATAERYELMSEVASLRSDLGRSVDALAERDRLLNELSEKIGGFEQQLRDGEHAKLSARTAEQALAEEKREVSRLNALLEARLAERQELTDLAHRLQSDKEHVEELLTTALARFEQVDKVRHEVTDKLARIEAARANETVEFEARASQLVEAKAEVKRLAGETAELIEARDDAEKRANRSEGLVERRSNEISYLNRRIDSLSADAGKADAMNDEVAELTRSNTLLGRRLQELEAELRSRVAENEASAAAVAALAERSSERDEFAAKVAALEEELDTQGSRRSDTLAPSPPPPPAPPSASADDIASLTARVRNLESPATFSTHLVASDSPDEAGPREAGADEASTEVGDEERAKTSAEEPLGHSETENGGAGKPGEPTHNQPVVDLGSSTAVETVADQTFDADRAVEDLSASPMIDARTDAAIEAQLEAQRPARAPQFDLFAPSEETDEPVLATSPNFAGDLASATSGAAVIAATNAPAFSFGSDRARTDFVARQRVALPADTAPDSDQAVRLFFSQENAVVIVDARSSCTQTGMRPSELFERLITLRDRFDVPVEVVVTPVSTPVGGAPKYAAVGVHTVTGADTVADRVRALCLGLPGNQPIVVIAADDHVRRAAIAEEANVLEPSAALELSTF